MSKPYRRNMKYKKVVKIDMHKEWSEQDDPDFLKRIGCM